MTPVAIQDLYPEDFAHCFGCGKHNAAGHRLKSFADGDAVTARFAPAPHHMAVPGFVYGGLVASLIDCHAMATAAAASVIAEGRQVGDGPTPRFVTASLNVDYLKPTPLGPELTLHARVAERSERKAVVDVELSSNGIVTARGRVIAVRMPSSMQQTQR